MLVQVCVIWNLKDKPFVRFSNMSDTHVARIILHICKSTCSVYVLTSDRTGIHECNSELNKCQHLCVDTLFSFHCECRSGYRLQPDGQSCLGNNTWLCLVRQSPKKSRTTNSCPMQHPMVFTCNYHLRGNLLSQCPLFIEACWLNIVLQDNS